jgi:hypothetical protein
MTASDLFDKAVLLALEEIKAGRFVLHSEQDIQAIIFTMRSH